MEQRILTVLKKWMNALNCSGEIGRRDINQDFTVIAKYIKRRDADDSAQSKLRNCRDIMLVDTYSINKRRTALTDTITTFEKLTKKELPERIMPETGQASRYHGTTKVIFQERLKCFGNKPLRQVDIDLEDPMTAKVVRRIIEKRMCKAYFSMNKKAFRHNGNESRHSMQRAVSFQLFNIGQVENIANKSRDLSSHWKRVVDPITGKKVYKKKVGYRTLEEAQAAIFVWVGEKPELNGKLTAYKCAHCGAYHIGHKSRKLEYVNQPVMHGATLPMAV